MVVLLLVVVGLVQVGIPVALWLARDRMMFFPEGTPTAAEGLRWLRTGVAARLVSIARPDGRTLWAYDAAPEGREGRDGGEGPVVLYFHGNAGNIASRASTLRHFVAGTGARVLLFDYSGFGGNPGSPSEEALRVDGLAAYDHLRAAGVAPGRIVLYGESIGAATALEVASRREVAGVVAQSTFSSLASMVRRLYPIFPLAGWLARGAYPSRERAAALRVPLLVVHGDDDRIVPFEEGRLLATAAPGAELLPVPGADHNDLFDVGGDGYLRALAERWRAWVLRAASTATPGTAAGP